MAVVGSFLGTPWSNKSDAEPPEGDNPRNLLFSSRIIKQFLKSALPEPCALDCLSRLSFFFNPFNVQIINNHRADIRRAQILPIAIPITCFPKMQTGRCLSIKQPKTYLFWTKNALELFKKTGLN